MSFNVKCKKWQKLIAKTRNKLRTTFVCIWTQFAVISVEIPIFCNS